MYSEKIEEESSDQEKSNDEGENVRHLPIANVSRIMKKLLDEETKISKESKELVQECVSDFISFITFEACEKCQSEKRKTINGDDLIHSLRVFGFDMYTPFLESYLAKYRQVNPNGSYLLGAVEIARRE